MATINDLETPRPSLALAHSHVCYHDLCESATVNENSFSSQSQCLANMSDSDDSQTWHPRRRGVWRAIQLQQEQDDVGDPTAASSARVPVARLAPQSQPIEEMPHDQQGDRGTSSDEEAASAAQLEEWFASRTQQQIEEICKTYQVPEATVKPYQASASRAHEKKGQLSDAQIKPRVRLLLLGSNFGSSRSKRQPWDDQMCRAADIHPFGM